MLRFALRSTVRSRFCGTQFARGQIDGNGIPLSHPLGIGRLERSREPLPIGIDAQVAEIDNRVDLQKVITSPDRRGRELALRGRFLFKQKTAYEIRSLPSAVDRT